MARWLRTLICVALALAPLALGAHSHADSRESVRPPCERCMLAQHTPALQLLSEPLLLPLPLCETVTVAPPQATTEPAHLFPSGRAPPAAAPAV